MGSFSCKDKEVIGKAIQVFDIQWVHRIELGQADSYTFCPATNTSCHMAMRHRHMPSRENEATQWFKHFIHVIYRFFKPLDVTFFNFGEWPAQLGFRVMRQL
jgi:hypothetical protein